MKIEFTVPGVPVAKARPKVTKFGTYTPKKTLEYENRVRQCWQEQSGIRLKDSVPLKMNLVCYAYPEIGVEEGQGEAVRNSAYQKTGHRQPD